MRSPFISHVAVLLAASMVATSLLADSPAKQKRQEKVEETPVFITGSLIPKRVRLHPTGTKTVSPVRIIDRVEIDQNGRPTISGAFVNEPSVRIIGH